MTERIAFDRLTGLVAFARAASLGSYAAAARAMGISPSAISKSVQRLEAQLGLSLFTRTTRSLVLTSEGEEIYERAQRLLRDAEEIEQSALAARSVPSGRLRIAAPLTVGVHLLAPALPGFRARNPQLAVDLRLSDSYADIVEEGIDVAIRVGTVADSRLIARRLGTHRLCAFAAPSYLARRGTPQHPDALAGHDCVGFRYRSSGQELRWPFRIDGRTVEIVPKTALMADTSDAVAAMLAAGAGIGISATYIAAPWVARGLLVPILKPFAVDRFDIAALWPASRRTSPNLRAFLTFLGEVFPDPAPWDAMLAES